QRFGQNLDETASLVPAVLVEQFLALVDGEQDCRRRRVLARKTRLSDVAQGGEKLRQPVVRVLDEALHVDAAARQASLAYAVREARFADDLKERFGEPVLAGHRRALGPDDGQRQPREVVALQARPEAGAQEGRLARSRRAEDDEYARDARVREP